MGTLCSVLEIIIALGDPFIMDTFGNKISGKKGGNIKNRLLGFFSLFTYSSLLQPKLLQWFGNGAVASYILNFSYFIILFAYLELVFKFFPKIAFVFVTMLFWFSTLTEYLFSYFWFIIVRIDILNVQKIENNLLRNLTLMCLEGCNAFILYLLSKVYKKYNEKLNYNKILYLLSVSCFGNAVILGYSYYISYNDKALMFNVTTFFMLILESATMIYSFYCLANFKKKEDEYQELIDFASEQIRVLDEVHEKIYKYQQNSHDYIMHLSTMKNMLDKNMNQEVSEYIDQLLPEVKKARISNTFNSNTVLSVILFGKEALAKKNQVMLKCSVSIKDILIPVVDLNSIISNMIDNAIEACLKIPIKKWRIILFQVGIVNKELIIQCNNSYTHELIETKNGFFISTKEDKDLHGKGLSIIEQYVTKNNGTLFIQHENGVFMIRASFSSELAVN